MADLEGLAQAIIVGDRDKVVQLVQEGLSEGLSAKELLDGAMMKGWNVVGDRFTRNEYYVPQVLISARAMKAGMALLEPKLAAAGVEPMGVVVLGTVKGDLHDIGKNLVAMMLQGGGFKVIDLGTDVSAEKFVAAAKENGAQLVGMSALLTTTMPSMADVVKAIKQAGLEARTIIGGAPVTQDYANEIGADGYAADAASAVKVAKSLVKS